MRMILMINSFVLPTLDPEVATKYCFGRNESVTIVKIATRERSSILICIKLDTREVNFDDPIFSEIKSEYHDFDEWSEKVAYESTMRAAFCVKESLDEDAYLGIAIIKFGENADGQADTGLKISTFKVANNHTGKGVADKLLSAVLVEAANANITDIFITFFEHHIRIAGYLEARGFRKQIMKTPRGEHVYLLDLKNERRIFSGLNQVAYEMLTEQYADRAKSPGPNQETPDFLAGLITNRLSKPIDKILEMGPGAGRVLNEFSKTAREVIAIEISPSMANLAQKMAPSATIIVADALDVCFPDRSLDGVYAGAFIHLFPTMDGARLIRNISKWVKSDGVVFISTTVSDTDSEELEIKKDYAGSIVRYRVKWTESSFRNFISENGLEIIDCTYTNETERGKTWIGLICKPIIIEGI